MEALAPVESVTVTDSLYVAAIPLPLGVADVILSIKELLDGDSSDM